MTATSPTPQPRCLDEAHCTSGDFELMYTRRHPVQQRVAAAFDIPLEEVFAAPQPYMGCIEEAHLVYTKGSGLYGKGFAEGYCAVHPDRSWFWTHFLGDPVMAGTQGTDGFLQLGFLWGSWSELVPGSCRALSCSFDFSGQILPTAERIIYHVDVKRFLPRNRLIIFDGWLAVDRPEQIIYRFGETRGGWFFRHELGIPEGPAQRRYQPDWQRCREDIDTCIDRARRYYEPDDA